MKKVFVIKSLVRLSYLLGYGYDPKKGFYASWGDVKTSWMFDSKDDAEEFLVNIGSRNSNYFEGDILSIEEFFIFL